MFAQFIIGLTLPTRRKRLQDCDLGLFRRFNSLQIYRGRDRTIRPTQVDNHLTVGALNGYSDSRTHQN
jgi:hypothetical protein